MQAGADLYGRYPIVVEEFTPAGESTVRWRRQNADGHELVLAKGSALDEMLNRPDLGFDEFHLSPAVHAAGVEDLDDMC